MAIFIQLINLISQLITIVVIIQVFLSYFMDPYHPVRQSLDRLVEPLYAPIRKFLPQTGMIDFSPLILIVLVQVVSRLLVNILVTL